MKVLLLNDVRAVGRRHEIKNVSDGYAVNFLIPNKLATFATDATVRRVNEDQKINAEKQRATAESLRMGIKELSGKTVTIHSKASEHGHLFRGLSASEIAEALYEQTGLRVEAPALELERPLKELGEHTIGVEAEGTRGTFTLLVEKA